MILLSDRAYGRRAVHLKRELQSDDIAGRHRTAASATTLVLGALVLYWTEVQLDGPSELWKGAQGPSGPNDEQDGRETVAELCTLAERAGNDQLL